MPEFRLMNPLAEMELLISTAPAVLTPTVIKSLPLLHQLPPIL